MVYEGYFYYEEYRINGWIKNDHANNKVDDRAHIVVVGGLSKSPFGSI